MGDSIIRDDDSVTIASDWNVSGKGDIVFETGRVERARLRSDGTGTGGLGGSTPSLTARQLLISTQPLQGAYNEIYVKEGVAAVAMCFDDGYSADYATVYPYLRDRNVPASFAIPQSFPGTAGKATWAQLKEMHDHGMELVAHSRTHGGPPANFAAFIDEMVTSANDLALTDGTWQATIDAAVMPGTINSGPYYLTDTSLVDGTEAGDQLRARFVVVTGYVLDGVVRNINQIPALRRIGQGRGTDMAATATTLAALKTLVAAARGQAGLVACGTHSFQLGTGGFNSVATWQSLIDFLVAERDAGRVEFYTLSAGFSLQHSPGGRRNLVQDSSFAVDAAGNPIGWLVAAGAPVFTAGVAPSGGGSVKIAPPTDQLQLQIPAAGVRSIRVKLKARRATTGVAAKARLFCRGYDVTLSTIYNSIQLDSEVAGTNPSGWATVTGDAWTTYEAMFRPDARSQALVLILSCHPSFGTVEYADVEVYKT